MITDIDRLRAEAAGLPAAEVHPDPPYVCFPTRIDWEMTMRETTRPPWPEPAMPARTLEAWEIHNARTAVRGLIAEARAHGWDYRVTEATGSWPSTGGRPGEPRASLAVRMQRGRQRAVAVYVQGGSTWTWGTMALWTKGVFPEFTSSVETFKAAIMGPMVKIEWPKDWSCPYFGPLHGPVKPKKG